TVKATPTGFEVGGSHTYAAEGTDILVVTVTDAAGTKFTATTSFQVLPAAAQAPIIVTAQQGDRQLEVVLPGTSSGNGPKPPPLADVTLTRGPGATYNPNDPPTVLVAPVTPATVPGTPGKTQPLT